MHAWINKQVRVEEKDSCRSEHYDKVGTVISVEGEGEEELATVLSDRAGMFKFFVEALSAADGQGV